MATLYCGPTSAGSATGADFTNRIALPDTTSFVRTNEYVIIGSATSYEDRTLSTALSGTSTITIRKANASQDSGVAGWSSTFESLQAVFDNIFIHKGYWIIDGKTRTETTKPGEQPSGYGIRVTAMSSNSANGENANNSEFRYLDIGGPWSTNPDDATIATYGSPLYFVFNQENLLFHRCAIHNGGSNGGALFMAHGGNGTTVEYCDFSYGWGKACIAAPNAGFNNMTFRYNFFKNGAQKDPADGTGGLTCEIGVYGNDLDPTNIKIYGNVFSGDAPVSGRNCVLDFGGSGFSNSEAVNCKVFNNTFIDIVESSSLGDIYLFGGSGNEARNNLFIETGTQSVTANTASNNVTGETTDVQDFDTLDARLVEGSSAIDAGVALDAEYNTDRFGNTRGADGTWDVGAFEFDSGAEPEPGVTFNITNLTFITLNIG